MLDVAAAIARIRRSHAGNVGEFVFGRCHDLALALWLTNDRRGHLRAGFRQVLGWRERVKSEHHAHTVYVSPDGECWDVHGQDAVQRWERRWERLQQRTEVPSLGFRWEDIDADGVMAWVDGADGDTRFNPRIAQGLVAMIEDST